ncbi:MAG: FAD binding domain-containing protein [Spirochaetia bacterium]|nr:FAD binding domain-containing protein [Spirochaetia bacterium]MCF7953192.1 FAD binding domain-containing protein [Spirochaetales bacterium]
MVNTYYPGNLEEALEIRNQHHPIPLMGGTDLMVKYRSWAGSLPEFPGPVMYINHLKELQGISKNAGSVYIGAGTTLSEIEKSRIVPLLLREAVEEMAAPALRNLGTLAGNIGNASPAGDAVCALVVLDASVKLESIHGGKRVVKVEDFITGPGKTELKNNELITWIIIPQKEVSFVNYRKVGTRKANALSKLSLCSDVKIKNGIIDDIRIAVGAVGPTVVRSRIIEERIIGNRVEELSKKIRAIIEDYSVIIVPIDDQRSTSAYRKQVALNLIQQFLGRIGKEEYID